MKKPAKILISIMLLVSIVVSFVSCDLIDSILHKFNRPSSHPLYDPYLYRENENGYTGGYSILAFDHENREMHWMETFDELKVAISHLINAGNKVANELIPTYENEVVDAKYFVMLKDKDWQPLSEGQLWYDRKGVDSIVIYYVGFLEEVTIEEIEHDYVWFYKSFHFWTYNSRITSSAIKSGLSYACIECGYDDDHYLVYDMENEEQCFIMTETSEKPVGAIKYQGMYLNRIENHTDALPESFHQDFLDSIILLFDHKYYHHGERIE